ncbi:hypothetical protein MHYP_G00320870 [Metynnis hypsauchen]
MKRVSYERSRAGRAMQYITFTALALCLRDWGEFASQRSDSGAPSTRSKNQHAYFLWIQQVCFDYKCQDVKVYGVSEDCSSKCSGRGVCDHRQQCHCDPGWAPPYCGTSYADLTPGRKTVIGVSVAVGVLLVLAVAFGSWIYCKKSKKTGSTCKMKTQPGQLNPLFENPRSFLKDRPQISQPTFIETTATPPCTPLTVRIAPTRPPPQPPKKVEQQSHQLPHSISSLAQMKPVPPTKPLRPGDVKPVR